MAILDLQDMQPPETVSRGSSRSKKHCGHGGGHGGGSRLSLLLC